MGPIYIKMGQFAATRSDLFGPDWVSTLRVSFRPRGGGAARAGCSAPPPPPPPGAGRAAAPPPVRSALAGVRA
ncbi:hypothetical protein, partial [Nocardia farcinica]|uniref:hypothetical protein n=1 Tax=Nocardia farcinica TaxID=37329 RepID=UPI002453C4CC